MGETEKPIRAWVIGWDGTEVYVAHSEEEMRAYYRDLVGAESAKEDLADFFQEISQQEMDVPQKFRNQETGEIETTTYRKLAEEGEVPGQILSGYI